MTTIIREATRFTAMALTSEGFPDVDSVEEGTMLHFVDTGEEYVKYDGVWELDLRKARALETVI